MTDGGRHPELREMLFADLSPAAARVRLGTIEVIVELADAATAVAVP